MHVQGSGRVSGTLEPLSPTTPSCLPKMVQVYDFFSTCFQRFLRLLCSCLPPAPRCGLSVLFPGCLSDVVSHLSPRRRRRLVFLRTFQKTTKVFLRRAGFHAKAAMSVTLTHAGLLFSNRWRPFTRQRHCFAAAQFLTFKSHPWCSSSNAICCSASSLFSAPLYSTLFDSTRPYSPLLNSSRLLYSTLLGCSTRLFSAALLDSIYSNHLKSTRLYSTLLDSTRLFYSTLRCFALFYSILPRSTVLCSTLLYSSL